MYASPQAFPEKYMRVIALIRTLSRKSKYMKIGTSNSDHTCAAAKLSDIADRCEEREPLPQNSEIPASQGVTASWP